MRAKLEPPGTHNHKQNAKRAQEKQQKRNPAETGCVRPSWNQKRLGFLKLKKQSSKTFEKPNGLPGTPECLKIIILMFQNLKLILQNCLLFAHLFQRFLTTWLARKMKIIMISCNAHSETARWWIMRAAHWDNECPPRGGLVQGWESVC